MSTHLQLESKPTISPFLICVLQIRGSEAQLKFTHVFGVIDPSRKHLRQVSCERCQTLRQMGIKALVESYKICLVKTENTAHADPSRINDRDLVKEGHVNQAVMENQRFLGP